MTFMYIWERYIYFFQNHTCEIHFKYYNRNAILIYVPIIHSNSDLTYKIFAFWKYYIPIIHIKIHFCMYLCKMPSFYVLVYIYRYEYTCPPNTYRFCYKTFQWIQFWWSFFYVSCICEYIRIIVLTINHFPVRV